jgi:hypothetical protein
VVCLLRVQDGVNSSNTDGSILRNIITPHSPGLICPMTRSNKRKRATRIQANIPTEDDEVDVVSAPEDDGEPEGRENPQENGNANGRFEVEAELWDTFREEFHEGWRHWFWIKSWLTERTAVEQLPLYLHRSYALLRELDDQVTGKSLPNSTQASDDHVAKTFTGHYNEILPSLQRYIRLRRSLAGRQDSGTCKESSPPPKLEDVKPDRDAIHAQDSKQTLGTSETVSGECALWRTHPFSIPIASTSRHGRHSRNPATSWLVDRGGRPWLSRKGWPCASCL